MTDEMILVPRYELLAWAEEWLYENDPGDGTDCITPFDTYLLKTPAEAQPVYGWVNGDAFVERENWTGVVPSTGWVPVYRRQPPSAPVGVEDLSCCGGNDETPKSHCMDCSRYPGQLAQQPAACPKCGGTGEADSGGIMPWGAPAMILCECQQPAAVDEAMVEVRRVARHMKKRALDGATRSALLYSDDMRDYADQLMALAGKQGGDRHG